ncbi:MAG TPA: GspH/FimT family pseudopilin [Burkholderiales bacterium]|nr:GspH/FimT family pseudopilin [Burkholderiales bacterium]
MLIQAKLLAGFTLVELMITIAVLGILLVLGLPEAFTWTQSTQIRTASESIANGVQLARGEAVRRNTRIQFMLTNSLPNAATLPTLAAGNVGDSTGVNWVVMNYQSTGVYTAADFVQGGGNFSSPNIAVNAADPTIVFTGLGQTDLAAADVIQVTNPSGGACFANNGPMRCLNVVVQTGGQVRMCDPAIASGSGDTRAC